MKFGTDFKCPHCGKPRGRGHPSHERCSQIMRDKAAKIKSATAKLRPHSQQHLAKID